MTVALRFAMAWLAIALVAGMAAADTDATDSSEEASVQVYFLEIVTPETDAAITLLEKTHGVTFGDPVAMLGGARTAPLEGGGLLSVRGPLRPDETPVVRPYLLVDDIAAAAAAAEAAGGEIAIPPMEIPGYGTFSIYLHGGIEHGLWQKASE